MARRKISSLRLDWDVLDPVTRGERLRELITMGCTRRGLAQDLRVSPTNIRFHLDLAEINSAEKEVVKAGGSARHAFEVLHRRRESQARMDRVRRERETSALSDQLARDIASFCRAGHTWKQDQDHPSKQIGFVEGDIERLFIELRGAIEIRSRGYLPLPPPVSKNKDFKDICQAVRPAQRDYDFWLSWLVDWLALAILTAAPEAAIRDAALKKAPALLGGTL